MAPQFVDFNADGHLDIFTATFDGSPHVACGGEQGFAAPSRLLDKSGQRILLTQFWNYETKEWDDTDRAIASNKDGQLHCVSSAAFDWDGDGDFDILLGDKNQGRLFRQMNEGTNAAPSFTGQNTPVLADGEPFSVSGGVTAPFLVDWDSDGLMDLVIGSFGDSYGDAAGGGVSLYRNTGKPGQPEFASPVALIEPSQKDSSEASRPDSGLYVDVVDYDRDGALDLLVGGYSHWKPAAAPLTDAQQQEIAAAEEAMQEALGEIRTLQAEIIKDTQDAEAEERNRKLKELTDSDEYKQFLQSYMEASQRVAKLKPRAQRESFVWLYRNKGSS